MTLTLTVTLTVALTLTLVLTLTLPQIHWPDRYVPLFGSTRYEVDRGATPDPDAEPQLSTLTLNPHPEH